jgi:hypothetical protein
MIQPECVKQPADLLQGESVVALYFADQKPLHGPAAVLDWRLDGQLTRMLLDGEIHGKAGEHVLMQSNGKVKADWVLFVGGGKWHGLCEETHAALVKHMLKVARKAGFTDLSLAFSPHDELALQDLEQQIKDALEATGKGIETCRYSCSTEVAV